MDTYTYSQMKKWTLAQWQIQFHQLNPSPKPNHCPNDHINPNLLITFHDILLHKLKLINFADWATDHRITLSYLSTIA